MSHEEEGPIPTLDEYNALIAKLEEVRAQLVRDARDELSVTPNSEIIAEWISGANALLSQAADFDGPEDNGFSNMIGLGDHIAETVGETPPPVLVPNYDNAVRRERVRAVGDLYYIYQHERAGVFRAILKLQALFRSGEVRLSDGPGAMALYQFDRKRVLRYTARDRFSAYRKVFGYTDANVPPGSQPNTAFHGLLSNFCEHVSRFFGDKRVSEVLRPDGSRETFGSMAVVRRAGLDLRHNLKQVSYGHIAVLRSEVMILLREAFEILGASDIVNLFGADNGWDVLEEIQKRYLSETSNASQRSRLAMSGRNILAWLAEDHLLTNVRIDFEAFLEGIIDDCDDWRTSAESVGLAILDKKPQGNVIPMKRSG
ncbi:hypothetical protein [Erythrobacter sp. HKB08]|uniref:hypothetical protein n=1 Tax=Erythrobacter sp. HKB08 TaxID=2502843 RepID=UPI0010090F4F|nr:hypothetical protein [Erythrobacter sp. HKB08]